MFKCKICGKNFTELPCLYSHIEKEHSSMIPKDMCVQQYYYYMKTGKTHGNCVMCKKPTTWNMNTGKYNRFCGDPKCKDEYVKIMKGRMVAKYGKTHLLNDPNKQREMLANRSISGTYEWSDGKHESTYTGSYELDFLKTLDGFFNWDPEDISMPSPHTYTYKYNGEDRFYIPDVYIHSLELEIEIKDGGDNPNNHHKIQDVDKEKERLKDEVMCSQKAVHYIKITNKNYENLFRFLKEIKQSFEKYGDEKKIPRIFKIEDIKGVSKQPIKESTDVIEESLRNGMDNTIYNFKKFNERKYSENDLFFSISYNLAKNNPRELQELIQRLVKGARYEDDLKYVEKMVRRANDHTKVLIRKNPKLKDDYDYYYNWINKGGYEDLVKEKKRDLKESFEIVEEKFEPDKFLVWFDKPIQKLKGGKINVYHGSSVKMNGTVKPISPNVGATAYSDPRWSTYVWDNREDAIAWASAWAIKDVVGARNICYVGHNNKGKTMIAKPDDMTNKEFMLYLIEKTQTFYVYEFEIDISDLEIGSCPTIREYTVSKPMKISRTFEYKLNKEIFRRCFEIVSYKELEKFEKTMFSSKLEMPKHRGMILNNLLKTCKDPYRNIIRTEVENGNVKPGEDISFLKYSINRHFKNDSYGFLESYIIDTMKESSISIPQMNYYLQNQYEEEMRNYLNTYKKYYNLMLKEQPSAVEHINEDIRKCLIVIDDLSKKEGVENNLVQFAKDDLGEIVKASKHGKPVKVLEASGFKIPTSGDLWISTDWHFYKNKDNIKFKVNPNIDKILNNYKKCIKPNDTFIFLGDLYDARTIFDMKLVPKIFDIKKLKGHKIMIKGNHDVNTTQFYLDLGFDEVYEKSYNIGNIVFSHEPIEVNDDEINIHGHIHFSETYWGMEPTNHLDAYIEHYDYKPVKINNIIDEYRNTNRITQKALNKFDSILIKESMVNDMISINDSDDIQSITVQGDNVSISNEVIECKIVYKNPNSKKLFSLNDTDSKLILENSYVMQRDKVGSHCSITPYYKDNEEENVLEFTIKFGLDVNINDLEHKITEGVQISNLYKFDDKFEFIRESCLKLFSAYPKEIILEKADPEERSNKKADDLFEIYKNAIKKYGQINYAGIINGDGIRRGDIYIAMSTKEGKMIYRKNFDRNHYPNLHHKLDEKVRDFHNVK